MFFMRISIVIVCALIGYAAGLPREMHILSAAIGALLSGMIVALEYTLKDLKLNLIIGGILGITASLIISNLFIKAIGPIHILQDYTVFINLGIVIMIGYLGITLGINKIDILDIFNSKLLNKENKTKNIKILDTSVIIDGRIADLCETGFLEGQFLIPQFVLKELQQIADSSDSQKRTRGRRGLDILQKMQKSVDIDLKIVDDDFPKIREVDAKLVALSQKLDGKIVTNDFNLNKVAELQGVGVLNVNKLSNAVKPMVLPGEIMNVTVMKEGKERGQGVAYLDDGTMVVVDNAKRVIGKGVEVLVTSVLQTTAGRMIFTKLKEDESDG